MKTFIAICSILLTLNQIYATPLLDISQLAVATQISTSASDGFIRLLQRILDTRTAEVLSSAGETKIIMRSMVDSTVDKTTLHIADSARILSELEKSITDAVQSANNSENAAAILECIRTETQNISRDLSDISKNTTQCITTTSLSAYAISSNATSTIDVAINKTNDILKQNAECIRNSTTNKAMIIRCVNTGIKDTDVVSCGLRVDTTALITTVETATAATEIGATLCGVGQANRLTELANRIMEAVRKCSTAKLM